MTDFYCLGDATRDLLLFINQAPVFGEKTPVEKIAWSLGGNAANVTVGLTRLGIPAGLVTIFGDDDRGVWIKRQLLENKVDLSESLIETGLTSNLSTILVYNSERTILSYHGPSQTEINAIPEAKWLYLTSAPGRDSTSLFRTVANIFVENLHPPKLAFNPNFEDIKKGPEFLRPVLSITDVLILNREEAETLDAYGPKITVITDGANGATVYEKGQKVISKPSAAEKVVEPTGAGDAFSSGFLAGLYYSKTLGEALDWGLKNAASVVQKIGAIEGLLTKESIMS